MKETIKDIQKTYSHVKPSKLWWHVKKSNKSLQILENGASGVQVGDVKQVID